jgi:5'-methylthioadenosine phosphorylase
MEGPAFSTKAESNVYRQWGMDVIGMTNLQEAKLAREAEICYSTLALVTDYDCWHEGHDAVSVGQVVEYLNKNVRNAQIIMREAVRRLADKPRGCGCGSALQNAIFTAPDLWSEATTQKLDAIIKKYRKP